MLKCRKETNQTKIAAFLDLLIKDSSAKYYQ